MTQREKIIKDDCEMKFLYPRVYLGCGPDYMEGWINVDINKDIKADIYHDLNITPYPFADKSIKLIKSKQTLEHLDISIIDFFKELERILTTDGIIILEVPNAYFWRNRIEYLFGINSGSHISMFHKKFIHPREIFSALRLLGYRWHVIKTGLFFLPINLSESNFKLQIRRLY